MDTKTTPGDKKALTAKFSAWPVLCFAAALALLTHGLYWSFDHEHSSVDTPTYLVPAGNLAHGLGFVNDLHQPELRRTPGYPLVLALFVPSRLDYLIVVQHLLCVFVVAAVALAAWRISRSLVVSLVAAAILAFDLATIRVANLLMTEAVAMTLVALTAWCVYRGITCEAGRTWWIAAAGLLGGCGALVRPVGSLYFLALAACLILALKRRSLRPVLLFTVSFLLLPVLWAARNYTETGYPGISTIGAEDILYYRAAGALAIQQPGSYLENARKMNAAFIDQTCADLEGIYQRDCASVTEVQQASYATHKGAAIILSHPWSYLRSVALSLAYIVFGGGAEALSKITSVSPRIAERLVLLITLPQALLAIAGCWYWYRRDRNLFYVLALTVAYFFAVSAGAEAYSRFRVPVMPMYALLAAGGAALLLQAFRRRTPFTGHPAQSATSNTGTQ